MLVNKIGDAAFLVHYEETEQATFQRLLADGIVFGCRSIEELLYHQLNWLNQYYTVKIMQLELDQANHGIDVEVSEPRLAE